METLLSSSYRGSEKGSNECPSQKRRQAQRSLSLSSLVQGPGGRWEWICWVAVRQTPLAPPWGGRSLSRPLGVAEASRAPLGWPQHVLDRALSHPLGQAPVCPSAQRGKQGRGYHAHFTGEETEPGEWKRLAEISPN